MHSEDIGNDYSENNLDVSNTTNNRQMVDEALDGTATEMLEDIGVPEDVADMAVKTNGGPLSPTNTPALKAINNRARNQLANGLSPQNKKE